VVWVDDQPVPVTALTATLDRPRGSRTGGPVVVLADTGRRHAFAVDRLLGQRDVVLKGLSRLLPLLPAVAGASVEPDGTVLLVLDPARVDPAGPAGLPRGAGRGVGAGRPCRPDPAADPRRRRRADRTGAAALHPGAGRVRGPVAVDGRQALSMLAEEPSDLVLTDVEMPNMDGFELTEAIRAYPSLANIPVLILTSRSSEADRQRGLDVGADGYIIKSGFEEGSLLAAVHRLLGVRA
jgi:two-component system chemotaxis sensor kinase CheA